MVKLEPMTNEQYASWLDVAIRDYAESKARAGNVASEVALEVSKREFTKLLPDALKTADTYIFSVVDKGNSQIVGMLWIKIRNQRQEMFIYDIRIDE